MADYKDSIQKLIFLHVIRTTEATQFSNSGGSTSSSSVIILDGCIGSTAAAAADRMNNSIRS